MITLKDLTLGCPVEGENGEVYRVISNFSEEPKVYIELGKIINERENEHE